LRELFALLRSRNVVKLGDFDQFADKYKLAYSHGDRLVHLDGYECCHWHWDGVVIFQ